MRVIAGTAKGRNLKSPKSGIRPLSNQAKEALFNILMNSVSGSAFLDLFAGTGSVGIEALSRGAMFAAFVEKNRKVANFTRENLEHTRFSDFAEVYVLDAKAAVGFFKRKDAKFDIIFVGAPYDSPDLERCLDDLGDAKILNTDAVVVAEHRNKHLLDNNFGVLVKVKESFYGDTVLTFFKKKKDNI